MWRYGLLFLLSISTWCPSNTLPNGAPESVCESMLPNHRGIPPMITPSPFRIETSSSIIGHGQTLRVEIQSNPSVLAFQGFMLQARNQQPPHNIVGHFTDVGDGATKLMNCGDTFNSATHLVASPKAQGYGLEWQAPSDFLGDVVFNATVAQDFNQFWVGLVSPPVKIVKRDIAPGVVGISTTRTPATTTIPVYIPEKEQSSQSTDPIYSGCGSSKTCFGLPDNCVESQSCRSVTTVEVRGDRYIFSLKSSFNNPAYVAVGLSYDDKMGDDSVIECIPDGDKMQAFTSWTVTQPRLGITREGIDQSIIRLLEGSFIDGTIYCKVERDAVTNVNGRSFDLINNKYNLLVAAGEGLQENGNIGYHTNGRLASAQPINLAVVQSVAGASVLLLRLHGAFMIVAWIGTASIGILLARYFKQTWVGSQLCGKDQWFAWHRICMVITWSLTMAGFVIIFVEIGGWSSERNPHAILGTVTTIICFLQPIGALLRPAPNSKNRPFFNWGHWLGGNIAHILSIVTIFFAVQLTKAELPEWMDWILVAFVAFHVIMHLILSIFFWAQIAGCASEKRTTQRVNSFPMADMSPGRASIKIDRKQDAPFVSIRKSLLIVYILIVLLLVAALVVIVVLAPIEETVDNIKSKIVNGS